MKGSERKNTKKEKISRGSSLIELLVAIFIFSLVIGGMVAVSAAGFQSYQKSKAVKKIAEDAGFAMSSITKDVRMGKIDSNSCAGIISGVLSDCLVLTRNNTNEKICYQVTSDKMTLYENNGNCSGTANQTKNLIDLANTGMSFEMDNSGFYASPTNITSIPRIRGWAEINLIIEGSSMTKDPIQVQTFVSSRDYGWDEVP